MKCPRRNCKNQAINDKIYGILPCQSCRNNDVEHQVYRKFYNASLSQLDRIQQQRDKHGKDLIQPYHRGKINPDFFKAYPDRVKDYKGAKEALVKS